MNLQKGWKELQSKQRTKSMRKIDKIFADKNKNEWIIFLEILESFENYYLPTYLPTYLGKAAVNGSIQRPTDSYKK